MFKYFNFYFFVLLFIFSCKNSEIKTKENIIIDEVNGGLILPDSFTADVVVDSIGGSRHLAVNDNGDIYVKLRVPTGTHGNVALRDTNNDSRADIIERFGEYPNDGTFATEMRIHKGYLYFSSELVVYRQKLTSGELIPKNEVEILVKDPYPIRWHNAKSLAFDDKGSMFVTFSAPTNACEDWNSVDGNITENVKGQNPCLQLKDLACIYKFDEDKPNQTLSDGKIFAMGIRSVVGISWNDKDKNLYGVLHGRDYLHSHSTKNYSPFQNAILPGEEFMRIKENENYGWPFSYYDPKLKKKMVAPEYGGNGKIEAKEFAKPLMAFPAHWAPNDLLFYKGNQFPERFKNGAFVAFHGSTNRHPYPQAGYIVAFLPFVNGNPVDEWEIFADGFACTDTIYTMKDAKYRPMGLAEGPDGSLYISESKQGKIWKIKYKGRSDKFNIKQMATTEKCKSKSYIKVPDEFKDIIRNKTLVEKK